MNIGVTSKAVCANHILFLSLKQNSLLFHSACFITNVKLSFFVLYVNKGVTVAFVT